VSEAPFNAAEIGISLGVALEKANLPYALGGALALAVWSLPRATKDVDLNVFVAPEQVGSAIDVLGAQGVVIDRSQAIAAAASEGLFVGWLGSCRIDVFTPSIPFSWEALRTRVAIELGGRRVWFLSAEALSFFKMMFFRRKDLADLERLISTIGQQLDAPWVRKWLVETVGEDDERVRTWDQLCEQFWK